MNQQGCEKLFQAIYGTPPYGLYPFVLDGDGNQLTLREAVEKVFQDPSLEKVYKRFRRFQWDESRQLLELRFGLLDGTTRSLKKVAKEFGVTRERIRQHETKLLRILRRNKLLAHFLVPSPEELEELRRHAERDAREGEALRLRVAQLHSLLKLNNVELPPPPEDDEQLLSDALQKAREQGIRLSTITSTTTILMDSGITTFTALEVLVSVGKAGTLQGIGPFRTQLCEKILSIGRELRASRTI